MSLVLAAHNGREIVVASDSLSTSTKTGTQAVDSSIQKVRQINSRLALAVTGSYFSDKLSFITNYLDVVTGETELDAALDKLFDLSVATMHIHKAEGFRMSLIGFNANVPGFKCVDVEDGKGFTALGESRRNYWVSGEYDPVEHALHLIEASNISNGLSTPEIENKLGAIAVECIERYPQTLGMPVKVLVLR